MERAALAWSEVMSEITVPSAPALAGPARAVDVVLVVRRRVEVEHAGDVLDVNAACRDVRRHKHAGRPGMESLQGAIPLGLGATPVQCNRVDSRRSELAGEPISAVTGPTKHNGRLVRAHDLRRERDPVVTVHFPKKVPNLSGGRLGQLDLVTHRVALIVTNEHVDLAVESRRKKQYLAVGRGLVQDAPYRGQESHVRHAVCLVHDDDAHVLHIHVAPVDQVLEPARTCHQDVYRRPQGAQLGSVTGTAVDGSHREVPRFGERTDYAAYLSGELAGRHEHESTRTPGPRAGLSRQCLHGGYRKGEGLA